MTGFVAAAEPMARGGILPLQVHGPHDWFGEPALLGGQPGAVDYVCMTPVELIGMRQSCLMDALSEEPQFMRFMVIDFIRALLGSIVAIEGQLLQEFFLELV